MKFPFKTSVKVIAGFISGIAITGLLTYGVLVIPTDFGKHEAKLSELHIGTE